MRGSLLSKSLLERGLLLLDRLQLFRQRRIDRRSSSRGSLRVGLGLLELFAPRTRTVERVVPLSLYVGQTRLLCIIVESVS